MEKESTSGDNLADLIIYTNNQLHKISTYFRLNKLALNPKKRSSFSFQTVILQNLL
jgi:hypothetical protein